MSAVEAAQRPHSPPPSEGCGDSFARATPSSAQPYYYTSPLHPSRAGMYAQNPPYSAYPFYYPDAYGSERMYPPQGLRSSGTPPREGLRLASEASPERPQDQERKIWEGMEEDRSSSPQRRKSPPPAASERSRSLSPTEEMKSPKRERSPTHSPSQPPEEEMGARDASPDGDRKPLGMEPSAEAMIKESEYAAKQDQPFDFSKGREEKELQASIAERFRSSSFSYPPQRYHLHSEKSSDSMSPPRYLPHYKEDDKWNQQPHPDPLTSLLQKYSGHPDMSTLPPLQFPGLSKSKELIKGPGSLGSHLPTTPPKYPISLSSMSPGHASPRQPDSFPSPATPTRSRSLDCENGSGLNKADFYYCHLCSYVGNSKFHFNAHMNSHFEHACPHCDYTSRTEGRLKRHIKDFHSEDPPDSFSGNKTPKRESEGPPNRPKIFKCRQCDFASENKVEFWEHSRIHIKEDKVLQCPKCPFVTEYKHHLEYHLRNHFGSKPFKCGKCNYSCVNKSMLNSHMKSHTNVYQYRCSDCTYATKYCHSLKLHLKKYGHKPATVLNPDGSLPTDGSGDFELVSKRGPPRGPRGTKREKSPSSSSSSSGGGGFPSPGMIMPTNMAAAAAAAAAVAAAGAVPPPGNLMPPHPGCWPSPGLMASSPNGPPPLIPVSSIASGMNPLSVQVSPPEQHKVLPASPPAAQPHNLSTKPSPPGQQPDGSLNLSNRPLSPPQAAAGAEPLRCRMCEFQAESRQGLLHHMLRVHAAENQDLFSIFGVRPDAMMAEEVGGTEAIREAIRKSIGKESTPPPEESEDVPQGTSVEKLPPRLDGPSKKHFNKVLAEDMLASIEAEALKNGECPLDLRQESEDGGDSAPEGSTPRKRHLSSEDGSKDAPSPRKRSRKGKAYKLDMISIRLQERYSGNSPPPASEEEEEGASDSEDAKDECQENKAEGTSDGEEKKGDNDENCVKDENTDTKGDGGKARQVIRRLETEYEKSGKWSSPRPNSPRGNASPRPLEEIRNRNLPRAGNGDYECAHCNIAFGDCIMYTMHMGYHGYSDPFKCNMCGHVARDKVEFFLHIARAPHE